MPDDLKVKPLSSLFPEFRRGGGVAPPMEPEYPTHETCSAVFAAELLELRKKLSDFKEWLEAEVEACRQLNRQDPMASRFALERVLAKIPRA